MKILKEPSPLLKNFIKHDQNVLGNLFLSCRSDYNDRGHLPSEKEHFVNTGELHSDESGNNDFRYIPDYSAGKYCKNF